MSAETWKSYMTVHDCCLHHYIWFKSKICNICYTINTYTYVYLARTGGYCNTPGECLCRAGYNGTHCEYPICRQGCHSVGGYCSTPGECVCQNGWSGEHCDQCVPASGFCKLAQHLQSPNCMNDRLLHSFHPNLAIETIRSIQYSNVKTL